MMTSTTFFAAALTQLTFRPPAPFSLYRRYSKLTTNPALEDDDDEHHSQRTKASRVKLKTSKVHPKKYELLDDWDDDSDEMETAAFIGKNTFTDVNL